MSKAAQAVGASASSITYANLLDISIVDKDGNEFQPSNGEKVKVEIKLLDKKETSETQVVHFGEETEVLDVKEDGDTISFETKGFSIYAIIGTDDQGHQVRVKYVFQNKDGSPYTFTNTAGDTVDNQIIKNGETLENVGIPAVDPNGETFNGWYIYQNGSLTSNRISFYPTTISISSGAATTSVTSTNVAIADDDNTFDKEGVEDNTVDYTVYVRPSYGPVHYLTFYNEVDGNVIYTKLQIPADANVYDISQQQAVPPDAIVDPETGEVLEYVTYAFTGWSETKGSYEAMKEDNDTRTEISNTTITVTEDMELYPIFRRSHWISFVTAPTGEGATYVPPVYILSGQQASTKKPNDPIWEGHSFVGWFTEEDDNYLSTGETTSGSFNWNQTLNEDVKLYAHWNAGTANYTIVYWRQLVTDAKNATDANKHYEYAGQENKTGQVTRSVTPGTVATVPVGYQINTSKSDTSVEVKPDGTSILNVYLDRKLITMNFGTRNKPTLYYVFTGLYGQTLAQNGYSWPGDYGWQYRGSSGNYYSMSYLGEFVLPVNRINGANNTVTTINFWYVSASRTIYYYLQNEDGSWPTSYNDSGETSADSIQIPEKFTGFTMDAYQYNNNGRGGNYRTWTSVSPNESEKTVRDGMAIRYRRLNYNIKFLDSRNGTELADVPSVSVPYGRKLTTYKPTVTEITPPSPEYEWTGKWYADQDCTTEFDWSTSMPSHDIAVYVNWNEIWYWIKIDPDGGELTSTEATWFWETKGALVEEYHDVTRTYVEDPAGTWYYHYDEFNTEDPDGTQPSTRKAYYTQDESLSTDGKTYKEDPKAYSLVGWYEVDQETGELKGLYNFEGGVSGNTYLRAVWRTVGQYGVYYSIEGVDENGTPLYKDDGTTRVEGTNPPHDTNKYADKSNSAIMDAIEAPEGYVFTGWYYDGKLYNPGDKFTVKAELDVLGGGLDDAKDDTITIYPAFVKYEDLPIKTTHIYWYGNTVDKDGQAIAGVTSANEPKDETTHADVQVNKALDILSVTALEGDVSGLYAGYEFKGWAKIHEDAENSTATTPWLIWDKDTSTYTVDGVSGITKIAADELLVGEEPGHYEKLVAVWEKKNYSVTVVKEVESSLSDDQSIMFTFTPSFPTGLGTDVQTNFGLSGNSNTKVFNNGDTENPETSFVPYKSKFSITEQAATGFELTSVTATYTDDAGTQHTIDGVTSGGEIEVLGDTVVTFKNKRQLVNVTVKKTLNNPYIVGVDTNGVDFSFTATVGTNEPTKFTVNSKNADGYTIENVPVGAVMVITETADEAYEYTVSTAGTGSTDKDEVANTYTFNVPDTNETVTFNNSVVEVDGINVIKTDDSTPATRLSGAQFTLTRNSKLDGTGSYEKIAGNYNETLTSGEKGVLINAGTLPVGYYKLTEDKSPDGYIITNNEVTFKVSEETDGKKTISEITGDNASVSEDGKTLTITNEIGKALPSTGGSGTLPYTLGGLMLLIASALLYGFRMRRRERRLN